MKKYNVYDLRVVKLINNNQPFQYFICEYNEIFNVYKEIFSDTKLKPEELSDVSPLRAHYSMLEIENYNSGKPLMLSKKDLLAKYNEINYVKFLLSNDEEKMQTELEKRGILEKSKIYNKKIK